MNNFFSKNIKILFIVFFFITLLASVAILFASNSIANKRLNSCIKDINSNTDYYKKELSDKDALISKLEQAVLTTKKRVDKKEIVQPNEVLNNIHYDKKADNLMIYKNDLYGYSVEYSEQKVEILKDKVIERGTEDNPGFNIKSGGHFAIGVWTDDKNLGPKQWLNNKYLAYSGGWSGNFEQISTKNEKAYSASMTFMDCDIKWIIFPRLDKFFTFGAEICGESKNKSEEIFNNIADSFEFLDISNEIRILDTNNIVIFPNNYNVIKIWSGERKPGLYNFDLKGEYKMPHLSRISFISKEAAKKGLEDCGGSLPPTAEDDCNQLKTFEAQKSALENNQDYLDLELKKINDINHLVSVSRCMGDDCVLRKYTTFIDGVMINVSVLMKNESQVKEADKIFKQLKMIYNE